MTALQRQKEFKMSLLKGMQTAFILMSLITLCGAQPVHTGLRRIFQRQRRNVKPTILPSASSRPCNHNSGHTAAVDVSLWYKNGWFLAVYDNGDINGTSNALSSNIKLQLRSVGRSLVRIYSPQHCLYVAMASNGKVFTTEHPTDETVFQETHEPNGFQTFASNKYFVVKQSHRHLHFLSMRKTGHMKNGKKTARHHRTTLLSVMRARETF